MHNHLNKRGNLSLKGQLPQINLRENKHFILVEPQGALR
ncbi:hypothetical protein V6Z12_D10G109400 [Gossypium hirsutum]